MKKAMLLLAVCAATTTQAQYKMTDKEKAKHMKEVAKSKEKNEALWDYDTVFNAGVPYCIVYKVDKGALVHDDYSVRSLTGQELIYVKYGTYTDYNAYHQPNAAPPTYGYYTYIFLDSKKTAETLTNKVYKEVVKNDLIQNGTQVNPDAETKFLALNPPKYSLIQPPPVAPVTTNYVIVNRNHSGGIAIIGSEVRQDGVQIGTLQFNESNVNGVVSKNIIVFLPNGTKVAEATNQANSPHSWNILTTRDNRRGSVSSSQNMDNMDIAKYLINGNYL